VITRLGAGGAGGLTSAFCVELHSTKNGRLSPVHESKEKFLLFYGIFLTH
jgi:hypothetical protein